MFCTKFKSRLKKILQQFDNYIDTHIDIALKVVSAMKSILSNPAASILTAIIPGELDEEIRKKLVNILGKVTEALTMVEECKQFTDINDRLNCFIQQLHQLDPQLQDAILQKVASLIAGHLDGLRFKQSVYDLYTQAKYTSQKAA